VDYAQLSQHTNCVQDQTQSHEVILCGGGSFKKSNESHMKFKFGANFRHTSSTPRSALSMQYFGLNGLKLVMTEGSIAHAAPVTSRGAGLDRTKNENRKHNKNTASPHNPAA
jgi:hypothetical protein